MNRAGCLMQLRYGMLLAGVVALAGCASVSGPGSSVSTSMPQGTGVASGAFSTGTTCYAPPPRLQAAYNQPYEINGKWYHPLSSAAGYDQVGIASWYDIASSSHTTAMGTAFHENRLTAASRILPLPSCVRVTNLANGRSILVLVNDRGPFVAGRIMDLSIGSARALGIVQQGTARVRVQAVGSSPVSPTPLPPVPIKASPQLLPVASPVPRIQSAGSSAVNKIFAAQQAHPDSREQLRQVVASAFASSSSASRRAVTSSFPDSKPATPERRTAPPPVFTEPQLQNVIYLVSSKAMSLSQAQSEREKLQAFGITTANLVAVAGQGYAVRIGPLARTDDASGYIRSLQRLRLGEFQLSREG